MEETKTDAQTPAMDVVTPPPADPADTTPTPPKHYPYSQSPPPAHQKTAPPPKPKSSPPARNPGVGSAIAATVIIILGLAAMAVYAYLKQSR